jgi:hypothetical protein
VPAITSGDEDEEESGWNEREFSNDDLVKFNSKSGQFIFEKEGTTSDFDERNNKYFNFDAF